MLEVVQRIGDKIRTQIASSDVGVVHRVPTKVKEKKNIAVRFFFRATRDKVLQAAKRKRFSANEIWFANTCPVYINEHLCAEYKALLGMAIVRKKEKG